MIQLGFSKRNEIGAKIIRYGTKDNNQSFSDVPSHFFIMFFGFLVIDSTFSKGLAARNIDNFKKDNEIVKLYDFSSNVSDDIYFYEVSERLGRKYDFIGILYIGWRIFLKKIFNTPIPKKNKLERKDKDFCTEVFEYITNKECSMASPNDLLKETKEDKRFIEIKGV